MAPQADFNKFLQKNFRRKFFPENEGVINHGNISMYATALDGVKWVYSCPVCSANIAFADDDLVKISGEVSVAEALVRVMIAHYEEKHKQEAGGNHGRDTIKNRIRKIRE